MLILSFDGVQVLSSRVWFLMVLIGEKSGCWLLRGWCLDCCFLGPTEVLVPLHLWVLSDSWVINALSLDFVYILSTSSNTVLCLSFPNIFFTKHFVGMSLGIISYLDLVLIGYISHELNYCLSRNILSVEWSRNLKFWAFQILLTIFVSIH